MDCREQSNGLEILVSDASFPFLRTSSSTVSVKIAVGPEEVSKTWTEGWWKHHVFFFFSELSKIYDAKVGGPELEVWHYGGCLESPDPPRSDCWPCPRNKGKKLNRKKKKVLRHKKEYFRFCGFHFGNICSQPTHVFSWGSKGLSWGHMSLWQGQARNSSVASWWQLTANV